MQYESKANSLVELEALLEYSKGENEKLRNENLILKRKQHLEDYCLKVSECASISCASNTIELTRIVDCLKREVESMYSLQEEKELECEKLRQALTSRDSSRMRRDQLNVDNALVNVTKVEEDLSLG